MRIYIVGAGAVGLLYGIRLAGAGAETLFCTRSRRQAERLTAEGAVLHQPDGTALQVKANARPMEMLEPADRGDWIWLTVKQTALDGLLLEQIAKLASKGASVLCLQNGVGHVQKLRDALTASPIYAGITTEGALKHDDRSVSYTGAGQVIFGQAGPDNEVYRQQETAQRQQKKLLEMMKRAGIDVFLSNESKELQRYIYQKLLVNAVINPLTAIYGVINGKLPEDASRRKVMAALHSECIAILEQAGHVFSKEGTWQQLLELCAGTYHNESSMLKDVRNGRLTEIQWINGGFAAMARACNVTSPLNDACITLIEAMQSRG